MSRLSTGENGGGSAGTQAQELDANNTDNLSTHVAVTGSPNTVTEVSFDVRETYQESPLLGTLVAFETPVRARDGQLENLLVLGQVAKIETSNRWHEDPSLKNFIKIKGQLPHLTKVGDVTEGLISVIGAYSKGDGHWQKSRLPVPAGSGLPVGQVAPDLIRDLMDGDFGYAFLGNFFGSQGVPAPVYVRHFGDFADGGSGEAYMGGVFGPSGSGKSVIAASLIGLWAQHPNMGVLILDPASEFAENAFARGSAFQFDFHQLLAQSSGGRFQPDRDVVRLDDLQLEGIDMFVQVLEEKGVFTQLGIGAQKVAEAVEAVTTLLRDLETQGEFSCTETWATVVNKTVTGAGGAPEPFSQRFCAECAAGYVQANRQAKANSFMAAWASRGRQIGQKWDDTVLLFCDQGVDRAPRYKIQSIVRDTVMNGRIKIVDLNPKTLDLDEDFKLYLMDFVFRKLRQLSHLEYRKGTPGNCLIVLDEAGRFIPQSAGENEKLASVVKRLTVSVAELRKMRCGFMFITQTIAEINKQIFRNLHYRIYGVGLGVGADEEHIRSREGNEAFELYASLPDPRLSKTFSFLVAGVLLALGSSGKPMVIEGFASGDALIEANGSVIDSLAKTAVRGGPSDDELDSFDLAFPIIRDS